MRLRPGVVAALVLGVGVIYSAEALPPQPGIAGCLDRAENTFKAEKDACVDAGRNSMLAGCSGAALGALTFCLAAPTPVTCIAANVFGVAVCITAFYAAWEETQSCIQAADARLHQSEAACYEIYQNDPYDDPREVQMCRSAPESEQMHGQ